MCDRPASAVKRIGEVWIGRWFARLRFHFASLRNAVARKSGRVTTILLLFYSKTIAGTGCFAADYYRHGATRQALLLYMQIKLIFIRIR